MCSYAKGKSKGKTKNGGYANEVSALSISDAAVQRLGSKMPEKMKASVDKSIFRDATKNLGQKYPGKMGAKVDKSVFKDSK